MSGPLYLNPIMPTQPNQAASMSYVDLMVSTGSVPEVPAVPTGQSWARQTGVWVPISQQQGVFLPLAGGTMQGQINMGANAVVNLGPLPVMPNGAAPAQWVLNQIAAQSLYQGTWVPDTNTPDLTQPATQQNAFAYIVATPTTGGVVVAQPIPGLQGLTVYNGDTIVYSTPAARFQIIHAGSALTLSQAEGLFVALAGSTMTGPLTLDADPTSPMQAATMQWVEAQVAFPEAPTDGQLYGRVGANNTWQPALPLAGGVVTGSITLPGNATQPLNAVPLQQLNSTVASYVPLAGNATMTGPLTMGAGTTLTLAANAAQPLQAIPLQQMTSMLAPYLTTAAATATFAPLASPVFTGNPTAPTAAAGDSDTSIATTAFVQTAVAAAQHNVGRNRLHNSAFRINQRGYVSGTALAAGVYAHDRWKAGAGGCTYTFTQAQPATTITITAGTLEQIVEALNVEGGTFTLSWAGTATGRVNTGTYAASPITVAALAANTAITVEFQGGTVGTIQLEPGSIATPYERQGMRETLANCQRFFVLSNFGTFATGTAAQWVGSYIPFQTTMRTTPTIVLGSLTYVNSANAATTTPSQFGMLPYAVVSAAGQAGVTGSFTASADL